MPLVNVHEILNHQYLVRVSLHEHRAPADFVITEALTNMVSGMDPSAH